MRTVLRSLLALASVPFFCGCQAVVFGVVNVGHHGIEPATRTYSAAQDLKLDIYRPPGDVRSAPVALFFYGGSWRIGERAQYAFVGRALAMRGIVTMVADYRKYPGGKFPVFEEDAAAAARWTVDHCAEFGGDPRRVFLVGHSAGAHMAALLGTDARYLGAQGLKPKDFAGVVGIAGPYDFLPLTDPDLVEVFGPERDWAASQPVNFVDGDEPPFALLQGDADKVVAPKNAVSLRDRLVAAGVPVVYHRYPGISHLKIVGGFRYPSMAPTLGDVASFITTTPAAAERSPSNPP